MPGAAKGPVGELTREVAAILRAQVARKQWTQLTVAARVNMSQSQVSKILRGDGHIDLDQLEAFASALDLKVAQVVSDADAATGRNYAQRVLATARQRQAEQPGKLRKSTKRPKTG